MSTIDVAVLSCFRRYFDLWVLENKVENETYHCIIRPEDAYGRRFDRIEKSYRWYEAPDAYETERVCQSRLKN